MSIILKEATGSYKKRYKCPYCELRLYKDKLIDHIDNSHEDMIPEGFSSTRIVFNTINKKEFGTCTECGQESPWNEDKARYERLCGKESCRKAYKAKIDNRMLKAYGKTNLLGDPKQQAKMLENRKISGTYKFSDGGTHTYTGSYERKCLEYFDKVLKCKSTDIVTPGPVIDYVYEGKPHMWITDIYYIPYNLVIEVKDGGDNPNNRMMKSYREKQIAKEEYIIKGKQYNYLRLTNNNFQQLFLTLAELKMQLVDNNTGDRIVRINENMFATIQSFMPPANADNVYVVNYLKNNVFSDIGVSKDIKMDELYVQDENGKIIKTDQSFLQDCHYDVYATTNKGMELEEIKETCKSENPEMPNYIYEALFHKKYYSKEQIFTEGLKNVIDYYSYMEAVKEITEASIIGSKFNWNSLNEESYYRGMSIHEDENGYYLSNDNTGLRTKSRNDKDFSLIEHLIILGGIL